MNRSILSLVLLVFGCWASLILALNTGCTEIVGETYHTSTHGVQYATVDGATAWSPTQIEAQEKGFVEGLAQLAGLNGACHREALAVARVRVSPTKLSCGKLSPSGKCAGLQNEWEITVWDRGCPARSAVTHELAHWIAEKCGYDDPNHVNAALWWAADAQYPGGCHEG